MFLCGDVVFSTKGKYPYHMQEITDAYMRERLAKTRPYTAVILKKGPEYHMPQAGPVIWEHGRRNFQLRAEGILPLACPINDGTDMAGIGIFTTPPERTREILEGDPAILAGVLVYDIHPVIGFPGSVLPA